MPFGETAIKQLIDEFQKEGITTEYSKIENEQFLFSILDEVGFDIKLDRMIDEFISGAIEGEVTESRVPISKPSELLKTHSELFAVIGNFEMRFRAHILNEMRAVFKEDKDKWYDQLKEIKSIGDQTPYRNLYEKLEGRRDEDLKNRILSEDELIYYADITDYKDIVMKNWNVFESKFNKIELNKEKFEHGMNELNKTRRKVMFLESY